MNTTLAGPSYFGELFNKVKTQITENIKKTGLDANRLYDVVIIITDGECHDMAETTKKLV